VERKRVVGVCRIHHGSCVRFVPAAERHKIHKIDHRVHPQNISHIYTNMHVYIERGGVSEPFEYAMSTIAAASAVYLKHTDTLYHKHILVDFG